MSEFKKALHAVGEPVASAWRAGKQAMGKYSDRICCKDGNERRWTGSVDLDGALKKHPDYAKSSRWDYGLGYTSADKTERALWVEVHPADTSEVESVIKKVQWLKSYLKQEGCGELAKLTHKTPETHRYVWVASGRCAISKNSPHLRRLSQAGLEGPRERFPLP